MQGHCCPHSSLQRGATHPTMTTGDLLAKLRYAIKYVI
jgi:hypothetical protein